VTSSNPLHCQSQKNPFEFLQGGEAQQLATEAQEVTELSAPRQDGQARNEVVMSPYSASSRNKSTKQAMMGTSSKKLESLRKGHYGKTKASPLGQTR